MKRFLHLLIATQPWSTLAFVMVGIYGAAFILIAGLPRPEQTALFVPPQPEYWNMVVTSKQPVKVWDRKLHVHHTPAVTLYSDSDVELTWSFSMPDSIRHSLAVGDTIRCHEIGGVIHLERNGKEIPYHQTVGFHRVVKL